LQIVPVGSALTTSALDLQDWLLSEVLSGVADVQALTFEAFVPQMLNYESVDGVNFKKGCYPGQEVVARSQFRGTLKRRAYLASASAVLQAGEEVFSASDPSQPSGLVAQACHHAVHGHWALVCLQNSALEKDAGGLGTAQGAGLTLHPLPYALRDDI
jgi:folate-binding protein YgfZ